MKVSDQFSPDLREFPSEEPFLISPLAQFSAFGGAGYTPLPTVDDRKDGQNTSRNCEAAGCPLSCGCAPTSLFPSSASGESPADPSISTVQSSARPVNQVGRRAPSGLSLTAPRDDGPSRSRAFSSPSPSRTLSRAPSRPSSPLDGLPTVPAPRDFFRLEAQPSSPLSIPNSRDSEKVLRTRLYDLLYDPAASSSSLPNMHIAHFPSSLSREVPIPQATAASRTISSSSHCPLPLRPAETLPPIVTAIPMADSTGAILAAFHGSPSSCTPNPTNPSNPKRPQVSRASSAAWALEQEKERRKEQEKEKERQREEQEKERQREEQLKGDPGKSPRKHSGWESERVQAHQGSVSSASASVSTKGVNSQVKQDRDRQEQLRLGAKPIPSSHSPSLPVNVPHRETQRVEPSRTAGLPGSYSTAGSRPTETHLNISLSQSYRGSSTPRQVPPSSLHSPNMYLNSQQRCPAGLSSKGKIQTAMTTNSSILGLYA